MYKPWERFFLDFVCFSESPNFKAFGLIMIYFKKQSTFQRQKGLVFGLKGFIKENLYWPACDAEFSVVKIGQTSDGSCFGHQMKFIMKNLVSYPLSSHNILFVWQNFLGVNPTFQSVKRQKSLNSWTSEVFDWFFRGWRFFFRKFVI